MNWFSALGEVFFPRYLEIRADVLLPFAKEKGHQSSFVTQDKDGKDVQLVRVLVPAPWRGTTVLVGSQREKNEITISDPLLPHPDDKPTRANATELKIGCKFHHMGFLIVHDGVVKPSSFKEISERFPELKLDALATIVPTILVDTRGVPQTYDPGIDPSTVSPRGQKRRKLPGNTPS